MKIARRVASGILMMAVVAVSRAIGGAGTTPLDRVPPTIWETQMTVRKGHIVQFQATVINKRDRTLTLLTAAHCLAPADMGHAIEMVRGGESLVGRIAAVWQNPSYHPVRSRDPRDPSVRDIVGVDNAIVTVAVEPGSEAKERLFRQIKTAAMAERAAPVGTRRSSSSTSSIRVDRSTSSGRATTSTRNASPGATRAIASSPATRRRGLRPPDDPAGASVADPHRQRLPHRRPRRDRSPRRSQRSLGRRGLHRPEAPGGDAVKECVPLADHRPRP